MSAKMVLFVILLFLIVAVGSLGIWFRNHGFSAREEPAWYEKTLARHARRIVTPAGAKELKNPYPLTAESLNEAQEHWVAHCSSCHATDGSGKTMIGSNLYPKVPDMREAETQTLSDGELFYIISNGVRFTGMPAWGGEDSPQSIWELVAFLRRLPKLSAEERQLLENMARGETDTEVKTQQPRTAKRTHTHAPGTPRHKH
jgi:cytochrome c553